MNKTRKRRCPRCLSAYWIEDRCAICGYNVNILIEKERHAEYERRLFYRKNQLLKTIRSYSLIIISLILFLIILLNLSELIPLL